MKLPNLDKAFIEPEKIIDYLLSPENSGGKEAFFTTHGFGLAHWELLRDALLAHAGAHESANTMQTKHGIKFIIEGPLQALDGRTPHVRAVWIIDAGRDAPRLVTAYPIEDVRK